MKRFFSSFLLFVILPFLLLRPLISNALDIQGTEYPEPSFLPIDVDFSEYDYYFLTVTAGPENPIYRLYTVKDVGNSGSLYVSATLSSSLTKFHSGSFTSFDVTTDYEIFYSGYNLTSGIWSSLSKASSTFLSTFAFDGYSEFTSSTKYIIGCNADIYDYSGNLVRTGDYDTLVSYFRGGLNGSSDRTPTGSGGSGNGEGSFNFDSINEAFNSISELLGIISNSLNGLDAIAKSLESMTIAVSTKIIEDSLEEIKGILVEIKTLVSNFDFTNPLYMESLENYFNTKFEDISLNIAGIRSAVENLRDNFFDFASLGGDIKKLAELFAHIDNAIQGFKSTFESKFESIDVIKNNISSINSSFSTLLSRITSDFDDEIHSIYLNISSINSSFSTLLSRITSDFDNEIHSIYLNVLSINSSFNTLLSRITSDFDNEIHSIYLNVLSINSSFNTLLSRITSDFDNEIHSIYLNVSSINTSLRNFLSNHDFTENIRLSLDSLFDDISLKIDNFFNFDLVGILKSIETAVNSIPENLSELLKELFIPKEEHFTAFNKLKNRFGFVQQFAEMEDVLFDEDDFDNVPPKYTFDVNHALFGNFTFEIDFGIIPYKVVKLIRDVTTGVVLILFIRRTRRRLPDVINGTGGN